MANPSKRNPCPQTVPKIPYKYKVLDEWGRCVGCVCGNASLAEHNIGTMIGETEKNCTVLREQTDAAQISYNGGQTMLASLSIRYDDIISWTEMYDTTSQEAKKMIVNSLIGRVEVSRGYNVHVEFNIDFRQFLPGEETDRAEITA